MKRTLPLFMLAATILALPMTASSSYAQTVNTTTSTQQSEPALGARTIQLSDFDLNEDGMLSTFEVGEMLFKYFDIDMNGVIDATEYDRKTIVTVVPMETTKKITYDYDNDGTTDKTEFTFETFAKDTQLARFDKNKDGLSPHEFIGKDFAVANPDGSRGVNATEWRNAYIARLIPAK